MHKNYYNPSRFNRQGNTKTSHGYKPREVTLFSGQETGNRLSLSAAAYSQRNCRKYPPAHLFLNTKPTRILLYRYTDSFS